MGIRVALFHQTSYQYRRPIGLGPQIIRLRPAPHSRTPVPSYSLTVEPGGHFVNWQQDPQSNFLARVVFPNKVDHFRVTVDLVADMTVINPFDFFLEPNAETWPFSYDAWMSKEIAPFLLTQDAGPLLTDWLAQVDRSEQATANFLVALNQRLQRDISYLIRMEPGVQTPEQTLGNRSGSCRDSAWLMVQILRHLGIAARFVSGYLIQLKPDVKPLEGPAGAPEDFTDLHAWTEAYLPGAGWVGLDPTSGLLTGEGHIPLAATPDPQGAAPITGTLEASEADFEHVMRVTRIHEDPRVTKPYTDEAWQQIESLGHQVDKDLERMDVRLTMGGEPTFVSVDDMDAAEWNTAAVGKMKRTLSEKLIRRLRDRFAPGALLHFGQGKWYPGEPLPRWALAAYWRKDGHPIWRDVSLIATDETQGSHTVEDAQRFLAMLTEKLEVDAGHAMPAFEDPIHFIKTERDLPINVDPGNSKLKDPQERERIRRVFERGLNEPVGYVLPLGRRGTGEQRYWESGTWMLRAQHMVLIPGDSPIGLRLPLDRLPWVDPAHAPRIVPLDPMAPRNALPLLHQPRPDTQDAPTEPTEPTEPVPADIAELRDRPLMAGKQAKGLVRTALCIEPRNGQLHVFLPPLEMAEDFLSLVAAIETTAAALNMPVILEGEAPPHDHRLAVMKVTPDPGVIEVNTVPASSWDELVHNTIALYEEAHQARLGTEKFMLDGRHTGTGGGNHVVVGGPKPADSPLLRRPDLLRSLVGYWLNHPALSYLFSGTFIGPTSQAPRVDEARMESVYELQIAFDELEHQLSNGTTPAPWLVDRIFRHLLVDLTGNTHRAEFCIDKLYSPDSTTGRLGLLEFRAFEMPPHSRMSLTQQLLLRTLIAWFWREPYRKPPVRWGTQLHDRFMLPHFVHADFSQVIDDLRRAGYPMAVDWFAAHHEFRFPVYGSVDVAGLHLELRQAIEPWHVLGEETTSTGTARYVDSSVERLQVRVDRLTDTRHLVLCNGRRLPLVPTDTQGRYVAGVRYRAWQPPSCLHPTVGVDTPLRFDVYDTWSGRSLGGCTYHVAHPGGRNYETLPVNAMEAEARRIARFFSFGHTPGPMPEPASEHNPDYPTTLDLRTRPPASRA